MRPQHSDQKGSTLVVTVAVVATILVLLASAVSYTGAISKQSTRSRKTALAMEIADGHLENLFTRWRNVSRIQVTQAIKKKITVSAFALPTQYFFTDLYNPGPAPSPDPNTTGLTAAPPLIALPDKSLFPTEPNYTVTQYRVQAVTPMVELQQDRPDLYPTPTDPEGSIVSVSAQPDGAFGPNTSTTNGQYSYFYLAAVDVRVPAIGTQSGFVTAKVRRVFEKKYDEPFSYALFYIDDLELQPSSSLVITGPIQTNGSLYIGTSNFTAAAPTTTFPTSGKVAFSTMYVNGASPKDPFHTSFSQPNFPDTEPPAMQAAFLPYGWNPDLTGGTTANDSYHDLIEPTPAATPDPIGSIRFASQADYRVVINSSATPTNITICDKTGAVATGSDANTIQDALTSSGAIDQAIIQDVREGGPVLVTSINIGDVSKNATLGMLYVSDSSAGTSVTKTISGTSYTTSKRGIRLKNGAAICPAAGLTFVSENPVYIQGDFNTGSSPPSNSGTYTSPTGTWPGGSCFNGSYTRRPCAIVADAISVLSNNWSWDNSATTGTSRVASNTTINAALVTGNVPSDGTNYSGGGENFIRFLENWSGKSFCYYGSMVQLWQSKQATGVWTGSASVYTAPSTNKWFYDTNLETTVPPGNFQLAAYLQQQRWYQVY